MLMNVLSNNSINFNYHSSKTYSFLKSKPILVLGFLPSKTERGKQEVIGRTRSSSSYSKLLLVLASTVVLGFESRRYP
jgi:hypothetical protein